jgi:hypothetical protein
VLTLVSVMLINWTVAISTTRIGQVSPDRSLEETFAT